MRASGLLSMLTQRSTRESLAAIGGTPTGPPIDRQQKGIGQAAPHELKVGSATWVHVTHDV